MKPFWRSFWSASLAIFLIGGTLIALLLVGVGGAISGLSETTPFVVKENAVLHMKLDTKISEKLNVLFDRLLAMLGLIKEPYGEQEEEENEKKKKEPHMMPSMNEPLQPTMREPMQTTSIEELSGMNNMGGGSMYESFEPMPANMF